MTERDLWRAEINQAVRDVLYPETEFKGKTALEAYEARVKAYEWLMGDDYLVVCRVAAVDPDAARAAVRMFTTGGLL